MDNNLSKLLEDKDFPYCNSCSICHYKIFYDLAPIGFFTTSIEDGSLVRYNLKCLEILGIEDPSNYKITQFYSPEKRLELIDLLKNNSEVINFEISGKNLLGEDKVILLSARLRSNQFIDGAFLDITQTKALEQEIKLLKLEQLENFKNINIQAKKRLEELDSHF